MNDPKVLLGVGALALIVFIAARASNSGLTEEQIKTRRRAM